MEPLSWCTLEAGNKSGSIVDDSRTAWAQNFLSFRKRQSQMKRSEFGRVAVKLVLLKSESPACKDSSGREQSKNESEDLAGAKPVRAARMD